MKNEVSLNFLDKSEQDILNKLFDQEILMRKQIYHDSNGGSLKYDHKECSVISKEMGRITIRNLDIPLDIQEKFFNYGVKVSGADEKSFSDFSIAMTEYSLKFGNPSLPPHYDEGKSNFLLDYQVLSNTVWPISIDGESFTVPDNGIINIYNVHQKHWRPKKVFRNGDFVRVLFVNFYIDTIDSPNQDWESLKEISKVWDREIYE